MEEPKTETEEDGAALRREVSVSIYPGREPVTVRTSRIPGVEPSREERVREGLQLLLREGRTTLGI